MQRNKLFNTLILITSLIAQTMQAVDYIDLEGYKKGICQEQNDGAFLNMLRDNWNSFKSSITETAFSDNINSDIFWNSIRYSLEDGTFCNRVANFQTTDKKSGSDYFLRTVYLSIQQISVTYKSVAPNGDSIILSGKIFLPPNKIAKNIIIVNHYTICSNKEAPSEANSIEGIYATKGYIVLMPDNIGYGISDSLPHPYLNLESTTTTTMDLLKAVLPYLNAYCYEYNKPLILVGYSQGGAATLALQKKLEEEFADQFSIAKVFAGAGPYNLAKTFDFYINNPTTDIPCSIPMLLLGMNYSDNLKLNVNDFFQPFLIEKYPDLIESKTKMMNEVNAYLGKDITLLLNPIVFNKTAYPTSVLYKAIEKNNISPRVPKSQLYLFHSTEDNMVPFFNSEDLKAELERQGVHNVQYDFAPYGNHMKAAVTFFEKVYRML